MNENKYSQTVVIEEPYTPPHSRYERMWHNPMFLVAAFAVGIMIAACIIGRQAIVQLAGPLMYLVVAGIALLVVVAIALTIWYLLHTVNHKRQMQWLERQEKQVEIDARRFRTRILHPGDTGNYGAYIDANGNIVQPERGNFVQAVAQHYSPTIHYQNETSGGSANAPQIAAKILQEARNLIGGKYDGVALAAPVDVPPACQFSQVLQSFQPTPERILLAYLSGGDMALSTAGGICHAALAGATGGGKSVIMRLLMAQLCAVGATVLLLNPHYTHFDIESGEDWTPFEPYLYDNPMKCKDYRIIGGYLKQVAEEMLPARLEKYARSEQVGAPFYLVLDELPAIVKHVPDAPGWMADILREGRKVKLFLVTAAQDFLVKTVMGKDGSGAVRDCFRTAVYVGGDPTTARVLLDVKGTVDDGGLGKGVVMLRSSQVKQAAFARVPYVDNESLYRLLGPSTYVPVSMQERHDARIIDADTGDHEAMCDRPANVTTFRKSGIDAPVESAVGVSEERQTYLLTDVEITGFIAAYKVCRNIDRALSSVGKGSSNYRPAARRVIAAYGLQEEAE